MDRYSLSFEDVLRKYECQIILDSVKATDFFRMVERLGVIQSSKRGDIKYLLDEYQPLDENDLSRPLANKVIEAYTTNAQKQGPNLDASVEEVGAMVERKKLSETYFKISELKYDFDYFERNILPELELTVLKLIAKYCQQNK
jgi:hypothetical protein